MGYLDKTKEELISEIKELHSKISKMENIESERRIVEKKLKETELIFNSFLEHSPVYVFFKDIDIKTLKLSKNYEKMLGMPIENAIGKTMDDLFPSEISKKMVEDDKAILNEGKLINIIEELNGRYFETIKFPVFIDGKAKVLAGFTNDITERKKTEDQLQLTQFSINNIADSIFWIDKDANFQYVNDGACRNLGYTKEELLKLNTFDVDPKFPKEKWAEHWEEICSQRSIVIDTIHRTKDGKEIPVEVTTNIVEFDGKQFNCAIARDISERKKVEVSLKESKSRFKALHNASFGGIAIHDKGIILECNQGLSEMSGYSLDELIGMNGLLLIAESTRDYVMNNIVSGNEKPYEALGVKKNGEEFPIRLEARNVPYKGKMVRTVEFRDISNLKEAEKALRESEIRHRKLVSNISDVIVILDKEGYVKYKSPNIKVHFGWEPEELISRQWAETAHSDDIEKLRDTIVALLENPNKTFRIEYNYFCNDGSLKPVECTAVNLLDDPVINGILANYKDISKRKNAEKAIIENQRLGAIGEMASAVAHDFNNSLQSILGNLELVFLQKDLPKTVSNYLNAVKTASIDAATRVQFLQRFGGNKQGKSKQTLIEVNKVLEDVIEQSRPLWKDKTEKNGLKILIEKRINFIPKIKGNEAELRGVVYNIVRNNVEAMPEGGTIIFETNADKNNIFITISDTGIGMTDEVKTRVFQPFFSTKGYEVGRGMGMSGAYTIIKEHKGDIYIKESNLGIGTTFEIKLPIPDLEISEEKIDAKLEYSSSLKILLVDDEKVIRDVVVAMLEELGHYAYAAGTGDEALDILEKNDFDLVLTDIGMPGMSGWQLADKINDKFRGKVKIAVVTGWGAQVEEEEMKNHDVHHVLAKPFQIEDLQELIANISKKIG